MTAASVLERFEASAQQAYDDGTWTDEQDRSDWFEAAAYDFAALVAKAVERCDQYIDAGADAHNIARDLKSILTAR